MTIKKEFNFFLKATVLSALLLWPAAGGVWADPIQAADHPGPEAVTENLGEPVLEFRPGTRPLGGSRTMREARDIVDEMVANGWRDDYLAHQKGWDAFRYNVMRADGYLRDCDLQNLSFLSNEIQDGHESLYRRRTHVLNIRREIRRDFTSTRDRFLALYRGESAAAVLVREFGSEAGSQAVERALVAIGNWFDGAAAAPSAGSGAGAEAGQAASRTVRGTVFRCAGRVLGVVMTLYDIFQLMQARGEYIEMAPLLNNLLEEIEMLAYLDVLIRQYNDLLAARNEIQMELYRNIDAHQEFCRCQPPSEPEPEPEPVEEDPAPVPQINYIGPADPNIHTGSSDPNVSVESVDPNIKLPAGGGSTLPDRRKRYDEGPPQNIN